MNPPAGATWLDLVEGPLPVERAMAWASQPSCGAVVTFCGNARDHSDGRPGVELLSYEAYREGALARMEDLVQEARTRWPELERMAILHRVGDVPIGESAVVVVAASPHRDAAFDAARFGIDALKRTVPIWKRERWDGGESWGLDPQHLVEVDDIERGDVEVAR